MLMTRGWGCNGSLSALRNRRWPPRRRATATAESRWSHRWNRWPDRGSTNGPGPEYTSHRPARICWSAELTTQPLFQLGTVTLHPAPDRRVIRRRPALGEQLFQIAERERVAQIPAHGTQNQLRRCLPPLEDCRSRCLLHGLFRLPGTPANVAIHPFMLMVSPS